MSTRDFGAAVAGPRNLLLRRLRPAEFARLRPQLEHVSLTVHMSLLQPDQPVKQVHFIEAGVVSMIATMEDGARIEVGMAGAEGMIGLPVLLGGGTSALEALVQVGGSAWRISTAAFRAAMADEPALTVSLLPYVDAFHAQISQSAACNGRHAIEQRLARWLLMTHDRVEGDGFFMTQEFLSTLLGVRRPGVTIAVGALQRAGLVEHGRGEMRVLNRRGLEEAACECYAVVRRRFDALGQNPVQ